MQGDQELGAQRRVLVRPGPSAQPCLMRPYCTPPSHRAYSACLQPSPEAHSSNPCAGATPWVRHARAPPPRQCNKCMPTSGPCRPTPAAAACLRPRGVEKKVGLTYNAGRALAACDPLQPGCAVHVASTPARLRLRLGNVSSRQAPEGGRQGTPGMDRDTQKQPTRYSTSCRGGEAMCAATAAKWRRAPTPRAAGAETGRPARREKIWRRSDQPRRPRPQATPTGTWRLHDLFPLPTRASMGQPVRALAHGNLDILVHHTSCPPRLRWLPATPAQTPTQRRPSQHRTSRATSWHRHGHAAACARRRARPARSTRHALHTLSFPADSAQLRGLHAQPAPAPPGTRAPARLGCGRQRRRRLTQSTAPGRPPRRRTRASRTARPPACVRCGGGSAARARARAPGCPAATAAPAARATRLPQSP